MADVTKCLNLPSIRTFLGPLNIVFQVMAKEVKCKMALVRIAEPCNCVFFKSMSTTLSSEFP